MDAEIVEEREDLVVVYRRYLAANVLFHLAAADSVDLVAIDYQASSLLELDGPMSNGELARRLGLTTGATTRLVDRLAARGLVHRTVAERDRRRAVIAHSGELPAELTTVLQKVREPIGRAIESLSAEQLNGLRTYLDAASSAFLAAARELHPEADRTSGR